MTEEAEIMKEKDEKIQSAEELEKHEAQRKQKKGEVLSEADLDGMVGGEGMTDGNVKG